MVSCLMGDSTALASAIVRCCLRIITEYVDPNYENIYPENITRYTDPIAWEAHLGQSYFITITGDKANGYTAVLSQSASSTAIASLP